MAKSKVVLHIGTHKTATTTIQDMFWTNSDLLAKHGLIYPRFGKFTGHHGLVCDWSERLRKVYGLEGGSRAAFAKIAEDYADQDVTVFLSSEEFSRGNPNSAPDFAEIRELLSGFDEIEVLCVLRCQWQFLQSVYLELSKSSAPVRPPKLVEPVIKTGVFQGLWVDYNHILNRLEQVFEPEEITFLDFESIRRAPDGVIGSMLRHLNIDLELDQLELVNDGVSNVSPVSLASWAANLLTEPKLAPAWLVKRASLALKTELGKDINPCLFTKEEFNILKTHFDQRNEVVRQRRLVAQPEFAITPASSKGLTLFRDEVPGSFWMRLCRILAAERL
jgi:hypothetical protein